MDGRHRIIKMFSEYNASCKKGKGEIEEEIRGSDIKPLSSLTRQS